MRLAGILLFFWLSQIQAFSQDPILITDSTRFNTDQLEVIEIDTLHSPAKATLYSAVLPGLGQAYNKKYWKIPIIYIGFAAALVGVDVNNKDLQDERQDLFNTINNSGPVTGRSQESIRNRIDTFRRTRDLLMILTAVWYGLNVIDAHIDAHLKEFNVNDDLALKLSPFMDQDLGTVAAGISLKIRLK